MDKLNKRAVVFTFIIVVLLSIIIISFLVNLSHRTSGSKIQSTNIKIETLNSFVKNLNSSYLPDALRVSSHKAMISLLDYEANNTYVDNINDYFKQVLNNGYYNNIKQQDMFQDGLNYTLLNSLNEIKNLANQQGTIFEHSRIDFSTLTSNQTDPWHVIMGLKITYNIKDTSNEVFWNISNREIYTNLNVYDYRDPIYLVEQEPGLSLIITKIPYNPAYFSDITNFNNHIQRGNFTNNPLAPSFIQRLQGDFKKQGFTLTSNGIESLLNPGSYPNPQSYSNADYQFYNKINGLCVRDMPANFKLDQSHINYYNRVNC